VVVKKVKSVYGLKSVRTARVAKEGAAPMHVLFTLHLFTNNTMNNNILQQIIVCLFSPWVGKHSVHVMSVIQYTSFDAVTP